MKFDIAIVTMKSGKLALEIEIGDSKDVLPITIFFRLLTAAVLAIVVHIWVSDALPRRRFHFRRGVTYLLYALWIFCIISPWAWPIFAAYPFAFFVILLLEIIVDEFIAFAHWFDSQPAIGGRRPGSRWELVAATKSSNNGYGFPQFYPVTVCDFNALDDPLWPHASTIYTVEIRQRCLIWKTITIWQVSLLNGGQKKLHEFQHISEMTDANWLGRRCELPRYSVTCYQSQGVIFVCFCWSKLLYVYDCRRKKSATYTLRPRCPWRTGPCGILCLGRIAAADGSTKGWRILCITSGSEFRPTANGLPSYCVTLVSEVFELEEEARSISHEEILFGNFEERPNMWHVRTIGGLFGVVAEDEDREDGDTIDGPSMLYNPATSSYVHCLDWDQLLQLHQPFASFQLPLPEEVRGDLSLPAVCNTRECIASMWNGNVYRAELGVPTLKYLAAKALFRATPDLRKRMTAEQFRRLSGIDEMYGHFG